MERGRKVHPPLPLLVPSGWKVVRPKATHWRVFWVSEERLLSARTDFEAIRDHGKVGPVESPLAVDPDSRRIYRYTCADPLVRDQFNEISAFQPDRTRRETVLPLNPNRWIPWLLTFLPKEKALVGLVSLNLPPVYGEGVRIEHRLGFFDLARGKTYLARLPSDCFVPLAISPSQRKVLFHGGSGLKCVHFTGKQQWALAATHLDKPRGACFHPREDRVAIGGAPLMDFDPRTGKTRVIAREGIHPTWHPDGRRLFYASCSGDLMVEDIENGAREVLVTIANNRFPELNRARPPALSGDGTILAIPLTRRAPREEDPSTGWSEHQSLCLIDLTAKEVWQSPGPVSEVALVHSQ